MKKKVFTVLVLLVSITIGVFAQKTQKLTFVERRLDGTLGRTITVDAFLWGWELQQVSIENGMQVIHGSIKPIDGEWAPWALESRQPSLVSTIRQTYDLVIQEYTRNPRASTINNFYGRQSVKIFAAPNNRSSPIWWNDDGRSFFYFTELWIIVP